MASYYWAKVYIEILDDAKMGRLSDRLWRRTVEVVLIAKDTDEDGDLPSLDDMAWRLRTNAELLEAELTDMARVGIVENRDGGWHVTNFNKRQGAMTPADRTARHRERQKKRDYHEKETQPQRDSNDTVTNRYTDKIREDKKRKREGLRFIPSHLATEAFIAEFDRWQQHHIDKGKPLTPGAIKGQVKGFNEWGEARSIAAMSYSRGKNWTGLFEPGKKSNAPTSPAESKILAHMKKYGARQDPVFDADTDRVMLKAGGYRKLCQMSGYDAVKAIRSAQKETAT